MVQQRESVLYFDGNHDYINVADSEALRVTNYTVEVWLKTDGVPNESWKGIVGKPGRNYNIWVNKAGYIHHAFHTTASTDVRVSPAHSVHWSKWQHVAITNDGTTAKTYINGELKLEGSTQHPLVVDKTKLIIGAGLDSSSDCWFKGQLTEVRLWDHARSQAEIKDAMFHRLAGNEKGLAGYWPLNDVTNNTASDETEHENHGKVYGAVVDEQLPFIGGQGKGTDARQYVLRFGAKDNSVQVDNPPKPTDAITVSCWAKSATPKWNADGVLMNKQGSYMLYPWGRKAIQFYAYTNTHEQQHLQFDLDYYDLTKWHHYAGTFDGQLMQLYVDGVKVAEMSHLGKIKTNNHPLHIGTYYKSSASFNGKITEAQVWDKALTEAEIKNNMLHRLTGNEAGLVGYWPLDKGHGNVATDETANKKHGTIKNAVWDEQFPIGVVPSTADKNCQIKNTAFGLLADVAGGTAYPGADVWGWVANGGTGQKWKITADGVIKTHLGDYVLDLGDSIYGELIKNVCLKTIDGSATQQWEILPSGVIKNKGNNFVMTMEDYGDFTKLIWAWNPVALGDFNESNPPAKAKWELIDI